jgi:hypothetical protein
LKYTAWLASSDSTLQVDLFLVTFGGLILILGEFWFVHFTTLLDSLSRQRKEIRNASWFTPLQLADERPTLLIVLGGLRYRKLLPNQKLRNSVFRCTSKTAKSWY